MDSFKRFVQEVFRNWSGQKTGGSRIKVKKIIIDPRLQNYVVLSESIGAKDFGKYTLNPEVQGLDFGQLKVCLLYTSPSPRDS